MAALGVAARVVAWWALSAASNLAGGALLRSAPLPLTATLAQLLAAGALSSAAAAGRERVGVPARRLLPLAAAKLVAMLLSHVALWRLPVAVAHTVKATTPLWTATLAWAWRGERVPPRVVVALLLVAGGAALAAGGGGAGNDAGGGGGADPLGLAAAAGAAAALAAQHLLGKRALRTAPPHRLLAALSLLGAAPLLPLWAWSEAARLPSLGGVGAALLAADATLAWLQACAALGVLARLSALGYGVAAAGKRGAVVGAALLLQEDAPRDPPRLAGMLLAAGGVTMYARARHVTPPARPLLPV